MTRAVSRRAVMTGPLASRLPRSTVAVLAGNAGTLVVGTATGVLAARALGPVARGEFVALQTWAGMLAMVFALGVSQTLVTDDGEDRALLGPLLTQTVASALLAAVLFTVVPMLITVGPGRSGGTGAGRGAAWDAVAVLGATCFTAAAVAASNAAGLAQRRGRMTGEFQLVRLLPAAATLAAFAALAGRGVRDPGLWMLTLGVTALLPPLGYHVAVLGGLPALARPGRLLPRRRFMRSALGAYGTVVGAQLIYKLDMLLVATFLAAEQVAFYAVAVAVAGACTTVCQATGMVMFSRLRTLVDPRQRARVVRRAVIATVALAAAVAGTIALVTPTAIRIVYGTRFAPAAPAAQVLVLATIPQSVDYLLTHVLLGFRAARTVLAIQVPVALSTVLGLAAALHDGRLPIVAAVSGITYTASAVSLHLASTRLLARAAGASPDSVPLDGASPDS
ncbi:lipopolysaccharide biosynthesis protein, partial [Frankia sp. BMG5.23]